MMEDSPTHIGHAELSAIYDNAPLMMVLLDDDRRVIKANRAVDDRTGVPAEKMVGLRGGEALGCVHALDDPLGCGFGPSCTTCGIRKALCDTLETGNPLRRVETSAHLDRGGEVVEVCFLVSTTLLQVGESPHVLLSIEDITAQKQTELALRESEERLHTLIENIPVDFWVMDATGHYIVQNSTDREIFGNSIGLDLDEIAVHEQLKTTWRAINERVFLGERVTSEHEIELAGEKRILHQVVAPVRIEERVIAIQGIAWDVTEERRAIQAQREHEQFLATLNEITRSALESPRLEDMLQTLADRMGELFAADGAYLTLWDEAAQRAVTEAAYGAWRDRYRSFEPEPGEVTVTESVLRAGHPLAIEDVYDSPYLSERIAGMFPDRSLLGLPLVADGRRLGAALIAYTDTHHFTEVEIARGEQAAGQIALALAKAHALRMEREQRERVEALSSIIAQVAVATDLQTLLETALERLMSVLGLQAGVIWLPPHLLVRGLSVGSAEIDEVIQGIDIEVSGPLVTTDWEQVDAQSGLAPVAETMRRLGIRATILVPLFVGELVAGGIGLVSFRPRAWTVQEISLAMAVGHQVGVAGRRRQMEEALRIQRDLALDLGSTHDLATAMNHLLEQALRVEGIDSGAIHLVDQASGTLDMVAHKGLSPEFVAHACHFDADSPKTRLVMTGEPIYGSYPLIDSGIKPAHREEGLRALASIPVQHRAVGTDANGAPAVVAVLHLASHAHDEIPTTARSLMEAIAAQIGGVVARIRAEEALQQSAERLKALHELDRDILAVQSVRATSTSALRHLRRVVRCGRSSVFQVDAETGRIQMLAAIQDDGRESEIAELGITLSPAYLAALQGGQIPIVPANKLPPGMPGRKAMQERSIDAVAMVPLLAQEQLIGITVLELLDNQQISQPETQIVQEVADSLAIGLHQARLYTQTLQDAQIKADLLSEVNHRVSNNLTAIIGLMYAEERYLSSEHGDAIGNVLTRLIRRVEGIAEVHRMLSSTQWSPLRLDHLVSQIIQVALNALPVDQTIRTTVTPTQVTISPRQAGMLALIVNELTTNTVKYAMIDRSDGQIDVSIQVDQDQIRLEFRNDGPGYPDEVLRLERHNVGLYLIGQLTLSLAGELTLSNDGGAVTTIVFGRETRS